MQDKKIPLIFSNFIIKVFAIILMTLDHIGIFLLELKGNDIAIKTGEIFRIFGRFAFPLFIFLLVEGIRHTRSIGKYMLRMGIVASLITIPQIFIYYLFDTSIGSAYSPFLDLLCCGMLLYLISRKDKYSWFAIIPLSLLVGSFIVNGIENSTEITILWFPIYLRCGYNLFGLLLSLGFYFAYPLIKKFYSIYNMDIDGFEEKASYRFVVNVAMSFFLFVAIVVIYLIAKEPSWDLYGVNSESYSETWALVSILFILFYSGKRGYNAKWFNYASYLYFPIHLVIIYAIFYLISL